MANRIDEVIEQLYRRAEAERAYVRAEQHEMTAADRAEMDAIIDEQRERDWEEYYSRYCQQHAEELPCAQCEQELLDERRQEGFLNVAEL